MPRHTMEFDISNIRAQAGAKVRIWKNEHGTAIATTVVDGEEGFPFEIDPYDVPNIIRANREGDIEALIKEFNKLPVSA